VPPASVRIGSYARFKRERSADIPPFSAGSYLRMDCSLRFVTRMYGGDAGRKLRRDSLPRVDVSQTSTRSGSARTSTQGRSSPLTTGR